MATSLINLKIKMQNNNSKYKNYLLTFLLFITIFISSITVWYSPVLFKGYSAHTITNNALLGRNLAETGKYSLENDLNVFLPTSLIAKEGHISSYGDKFTSIFYSKVLKVIKINDINVLLLVSIIIHAFSLIIFTLIVYFLFDLKIASIFSIIYILLPFNWYDPYHIGLNEFALLFFALFFLFFFLGERQKKYQNNYLIISGIFLSLAGLSREAMLIIVPFLFIYLWLKNRSKLLFVFIPFFIFLVALWLPNLKNNAYIQFFSSNVSSEIQGADFSYYGHAYPDPYTYHFENEKFLQEYTNTHRMSLSQKLERYKVMQNMGIRSITLGERFLSGTMISVRHIARLISLEEVGGPFIFILLLLGIYVLKRKDANLQYFLIYWIISTILLLSFFTMGSRNHLVDFNWAIALFVTIGITELSDILAKYLNLKENKIAYLLIAVTILASYNLLLVNHITWSREYDNSPTLKNLAFSQAISQANIKENDVIAIPFGSDDMCTLSFLNNKAFVTFRNETIEKLLENNRLDNIFNKFKVTYILGYSDKLTAEITRQTNTVNIASESIEVVKPDMSRNKNWLMNVIK